MNILLYEFVTGGGCYAVHDGAEPPQSLAAEGAAMLIALATDLAALPRTQLTVLRDQRRADVKLPECQIVKVGSAKEEFAAFSAAAKVADWSIVIAPEFDGNLLERCRWVADVGGKLLGPSTKIVAIAGDKHATAVWLQSAGVNAPRGLAVRANEPLPGDFRYPAVWKPRYGAGSQGVRLLAASPDRTSVGFVPHELGRLEEYCPGLPVSVACLCGPVGIFPLPVCRQHLSQDGSFTYLGGSLPLSTGLAERASSIARRAVAALPAPLGYIGVDMVLGAADDGSHDVVIEINPRFTTSYVGLRAAADCNLAAALLNIATGRQPKMKFNSRVVQFSAAGTVQSQPA